MTNTQTKKTLTTTLLAGLTSLVLISPVAFAEQKLRGNVQGRQGPLTDGEVAVLDHQGQALVTAQVDNHGSFQLTIPHTEHYPLIVQVTPQSGSDKRPLKGYVVDDKTDSVTITPVSTRIVDIAVRVLGGLTKENLLIASKHGLATSFGGTGGAGGGEHAGH